MDGGLLGWEVKCCIASLIKWLFGIFSYLNFALDPSVVVRDSDLLQFQILQVYDVFNGCPFTSSLFSTILPFFCLCRFFAPTLRNRSVCSGSIAKVNYSAIYSNLTRVYLDFWFLEFLKNKFYPSKTIYLIFFFISIFVEFILYTFLPFQKRKYHKISCNPTTTFYLNFIFMGYYSILWKLQYKFI